MSCFLVCNACGMRVDLDGCSSRNEIVWRIHGRRSPDCINGDMNIIFSVERTKRGDAAEINGRRESTECDEMEEATCIHCGRADGDGDDELDVCVACDDVFCPRCLFSHPCGVAA